MAAEEKLSLYDRYVERNCASRDVKLRDSLKAILKHFKDLDKICIRQNPKIYRKLKSRTFHLEFIRFGVDVFRDADKLDSPYKIITGKKFYLEECRENLEDTLKTDVRLLPKADQDPVSALLSSICKIVAELKPLAFAISSQETD